MFNLADWLLQRAKISAHKNDCKLKISIFPDRIDYEYVSSKPDEYTDWQHNFKNAGLFIARNIEEIDIEDSVKDEIFISKDTIQELDAEMITKDEAHQTVNNSLLKKLLMANDDMQKQEYLLYGLAALQFIVILILIG